MEKKLIFKTIKADVDKQMKIFENHCKNLAKTKQMNVLEKSQKPKNKGFFKSIFGV